MKGSDQVQWQNKLLYKKLILKIQATKKRHQKVQLNTDCRPAKDSLLNYSNPIGLVMDPTPTPAPSPQKLNQDPYHEKYRTVRFGNESGLILIFEKREACTYLLIHGLINGLMDRNNNFWIRNYFFFWKL